MSDSFFGFDASLPGEDDDGGGGRSRGGGRILGGGRGSGGRGSDSEEEYDALNDETFGQAREDDWEDLHENLVRLDQREGGDGDSGPDSDLDINFSSVGIDNFELDNDTEPEARLQLDPSVWTMPSKPETPRHTVPPVPASMPPSVVGGPTPIPGAGADRFGGPLNRFPMPNPGMRICSLEEIEQNMIKQQQEQMRRGMTPLPRPPPGFLQSSNATPTVPPTNSLPPAQMIHRPLPMPIGFHSPGIMGGAPGGQPPPPSGMGPLFPPTNMPPPSGGQLQPGGGVPPFPFPINFQGPPGVPSPSGPMLPPNNSSSNNNNNNNNNASFSQRLVEEIQQNHPMLPHYRQQPPPGTLAQPTLPIGVPPPGPGQMPPMPPHGGNFKHPFMGHHHPAYPPNWNGPHHQHHGNPHHHGGYHHPGYPGGHHHFPQQQQQQQQGQGQGHHHSQQHQQQQQGGGHRLHNGKQNRNYEYDEYANMMSERAKHWLLGIQLSQLNKDTAYYNDYYFCVIRDRKERERGAERESKAHKDNTFYHPFSQQQHWNGMSRERRNSENSSSTKDGIKEIPRRYKLVQFENSLGKLQCGSVIAPRKIIDQDVVVDRSVADGGSGGTGNNSAGAASSSSESVHNQRRSRQILLHVENLYRLVLRLEDMSNQLAIEAKQQMKEKRAKERLLAQEKQASGGTDEQNNVNSGVQLAPVPATPVSEVEQDTMENLHDRILPGVNAEGVLRLLSVRKGKLLLTRIQKALGEHPARWTVWCTVLSTIVVLPKRDREDSEDQLSPLFSELEMHVKYAQPAELVPLFDTLLNTDQLLPLVPRCKFLLLTVLTLIAQMEQLMATDVTLLQAAIVNGAIDSEGDRSADISPCGSPTSRVVWTRWMALLRELGRVLDGVPAGTTGSGIGGTKQQKVLLKLDSSCGKVKQLWAHLQRYPELALERKLRAIVSIIDAGSGGPSTLATDGATTPVETSKK